MKRLVLVTIMASVFTAGCASVPLFDLSQPGVQASAPAAASSAAGLNRPNAAPDQVVVHDAAGSVVVQKVESRSGVSSTTVEKLAKHFGCAGGAGAGLITEKGPVEVYRMQCDNGKTFTAKCELRQCQPMR
jgi:hypothetical protein